jgi:Tol biopolymer transport system component
VQPLTGTWSEAGDILFGSVRDGIYRVPASGGTQELFVRKTPEDIAVLWPQFLPDGRHFLYVVTSRRTERAGIYAGSLDSGSARRVAATRSYAVYVPDGFLLFIQDGTLVAQPFDAATLRASGKPIPVADRVAFNVGNGRGVFGASSSGVLAFRRASAAQLVWFDRDGNRLGRVGPAGEYLHFALSPDNTHIAAARLDPRTGTSDIWIIDVADGNARRLTFEGARAAHPLWSRDGAAILFASDTSGRREIRKVVLNGQRDELVFSSKNSAIPADWSPEGNLLFYQWDHNTKQNFSLVSLGKSTAPMPLPYLGADESSGRISPDGRWLVYGTWESGWTVYVRPLQSSEGRWQLSAPGTVEPQPQWRGDGREIYFVADDLSLMAADVNAEHAFRLGPARRLFRTTLIAPSGMTGNAYDVTSDGRRFLLKLPVETPSISVVVEWASLITSGR